MDIVLGQVHTGVFYAFDGLDQPMTGQASNFVATMTVDGVSEAKAVTITEVDDVNRKGEYQYSFTADEKRIWYLHITLPGTDEVGWEAHFRVVDKLAEDIDLQNLGPGDRTVEVTIEDESTHAPIPGAWVQVYDETMATLIALGFTNGSGKITFSLYDGDYKVFVSKIGQYVFAIPFDLAVSEGADPPPDVEVTYEGTVFSPAMPPSPDMCLVYGWEWAPNSGGLAVVVEAEIMASKYFLQTNPHVIRKVSTTSDPTHVNGPGYWQLLLTRSSLFAGDETVTYRFSIDEEPQDDYEIPDVATIAFKELREL